MAVNGTVSTVGGTYAAYGQKLAIERGQVTFNGPVENPRLDIEATRPHLDLRVGVLVTGTALNPRVRLFSEPEMAEVDKLSWLVLGRAGDNLGRTDTALLQRAALALWAGEGEGLSDQFTHAIGLDELSLRQTDGTDGGVRETVISLGKQISQRWYVGYERSLNATAGSWQLIYRIAQRFTVRAQTGKDNSLDVIWTWRWH
jgi:translocation and assembly module TamB